MCKGKYSKSTGVKPLAMLLAMALLVGCAIGGTLAWLVDSTQEVKNTFTTSNIEIDLNEADTTKDTDTGNETKDYKMVPGWTLSKDPKVTVKAGSEDCYLFVKVTTTGKAAIGETTYGISDYLAYKLRFEATDLTEGTWTKGTGSGEGGNGVPTDVYFIKLENITADKEFELLLKGEITVESVKYEWKDNEVLVKPTVTKEMMEALNAEGAVKPSITFTAYASQLWKTNKPADLTETSAVTTAQFTAAQAWENVNPSSNS